MSNYTNIFERYEKKYKLNNTQYTDLKNRIADKFKEDRFYKSTISNIYFDTPDFKLIRRSIEKPVYKEKLRLRSYSVPSDNTNVFIEIKKKYKGVVYKRRLPLDYKSAVNYLYKNKKPDENSQILKEIDWFKTFYENLIPAMYISYDRIALVCKDNPSLRLTFDTNITYRQSEVELSKGVWGNKLLQKGTNIMEIKFQGAIPLWFTKELDAARIYPTSFSKYGEIYKTILGADKDSLLERIICA